MDVSRRQFLAGAAGAVAGGLILTREEALAHPAIDSAIKSKIERTAVLEDSEGSQGGVVPWCLVWADQVYYVTSWTQSNYYTTSTEALTISAVRL